MTPAVVVGDPGKVARAGELATPTLTAQVGGACSIVHVLEWKEGMAILPSSNLKVNGCFRKKCFVLSCVAAHLTAFQVSFSLARSSRCLTC